MKNIVWKYFTANNTQKYIDVLPSMVEKYKNKYRRLIKLTPSDARNPANYPYVHNALYAKVNARKATSPPLKNLAVYLMERYDACQDIPDPLDPTQKNLLLLDDCSLGKQNKDEAYYTRGRHNNCDTIYIAQNYFRLPRHTIRENSNFIILFPQDVKNLTHIHPGHCASDISLLEFKQVCHRVWIEKHTFITIESQVHQWMESTNRIQYTNGWKVPSEFQPILFPYWYYIKPLLYSYCQSSWKHSGQSSWKHPGHSSWKRSGISSLQQNYYHTKRCCTMKLQESGMHSVMQTKWNVKNATVCV